MVHSNIKIGKMFKNIGLNIKENLIWIINKVKVNGIYQMLKSFKDILNKIWLMDKDY
jgi:hypothetical protein